MSPLADVADQLADRLEGFEPEALLTLGSGLGGLVDDMEAVVTVPFAEVGLPDTTVPGHAGRLVAGHLGGVPVLCQQGRVHLYEGRAIAEVVAVVRAAAALGATTYVATNAAGGISSGPGDDLAAGDLMLITDHLNLTGHNPLIGLTSPRFLDLTDAYDRSLRTLAHEAASAAGVNLHEGVYAGVVGPTFETPAEIAWMRTIGARAVGMSTVCEVIAARDRGLAVLGLSLITNVHLPGGTPTGHDEVMDMGARAGPGFATVLRELFRLLGSTTRQGL